MATCIAEPSNDLAQVDASLYTFPVKVRRGEAQNDAHACDPSPDAPLHFLQLKLEFTVFNAFPAIPYHREQS